MCGRDWLKILLESVLSNSGNGTRFLLVLDIKSSFRAALTTVPIVKRRQGANRAYGTGSGSTAAKHKGAISAQELLFW